MYIFFENFSMQCNFSKKNISIKIQFSNKFQFIIFCGVICIWGAFPNNMQLSPLLLFIVLIYVTVLCLLQPDWPFQVQQLVLHYRSLHGNCYCHGFFRLLLSRYRCVQSLWLQAVEFTLVPVWGSLFYRIWSSMLGDQSFKSTVRWINKNGHHDCLIPERAPFNPIFIENSNV
jgi:hypothetical protein